MRLVVQIPLEHQVAYEAGEEFIMESAKTGIKWPTLMKVAENGKNQIVAHLPIQEE